MDNSASVSTHEWATPRAAGIVMLVGGVILLISALLAQDPPGRVLLTVAGVALLGWGVYGLTIRPRLALIPGDSPQLAVRTLGGRQSYRPEDIERIRIRAFRRIGRSVGQLEIDIADDEDGKLLVFGRWDLGTDLLHVADELRQAGFVVSDERK